jgi:cytochrome P450
VPAIEDIKPITTVDLPELDLRGDAFAMDPNRALAEVRRQSPLARSRRGVEVLSYELISKAFVAAGLDTADSDHYRRLGAGPALLRFVDDGLLSTMDRARHDPIRRLMMQAFAFRRIDVHRAMMREVATEMLQLFIDDGRCDFVQDFTEFYPITVLCRLIGVPPADISRFAAAAHELHLMAAVPMAPGFPRLEAALAELDGYVSELLQLRRENPQDDFISSLLAAQEQEGRLSEAELVGNLINLIFAGMGTTTMQLASALRLLTEHGLWDQVHFEPELLPKAVDECLRFSPVTQFVVRVPTEDTVFGGYLFPKGERIILNLLAGSRDPALFPEPDKFDIGREKIDSRLPFGWGAHRCLGQPLARGLIEVALSVLSSELTDIEVESLETAAHPAAMLGGPSHLLITFQRRTS